MRWRKDSLAERGQPVPGVSAFGQGIAISLIVPTRDEEETIAAFCARLAAVLGQSGWEAVFVDDSRDSTPRVLAGLADADPRFRLLHRERPTGLATAVLEGFAQTKGQVICVMDADLQHPPELVPALVAAVQGGADLAVASRYAAGGSAAAVAWPRRVLARLARALALLVLPEARRTTDPLSGFFACRRPLLAAGAFRPSGWKILLEILVRARPRRVVDVPFCFAPRLAGTSKLGFAQAMAFVCHLIRLAWGGRGLFYLGIGALGVAVNLLACDAALKAGVPALLSGLLGTQIAMAGNFVLHSRFTWSDRARAGWRRAFRFLAVSEAGVALNLAVLALARSHGLAVLEGQLAGVAAALPLTFALHNGWTWKEVAADERPALTRVAAH